LDPAKAQEINEKLAGSWEYIRRRIAIVIRPSESICGVLTRAGAPRRPEDLGWPPEFYREAVRHARKIRNRYTFLNFTADCGLLDQVELFQA